MNKVSVLPSISGFGFESIGRQVASTLFNDFTDERSNLEILSANLLYTPPMTLFPNPALARDVVRISFESSTHGNINIKVYNEYRHCVLSHLILNADGINNHFLNIQNLRPGIYSVEMEHDGLKGKQKLIVQ